MKQMIVFIVLGILALPLVLALSVADFAPDGFKFAAPEDTSRSAALITLGDARATVGTMEALNFSVQFVTDALDEADTAFEQADYVSVFKLSQLIHYVYQKSIDFRDAVQVMAQQIDELQRENADIASPRGLLNDAMDAFYAERYDEADILLGRADIALKQAAADYRRAALIERFSKHVLLRYWWQIIVVFSIVAVASVPMARQVRKELLKRRIGRMKEELKHAQELIKIMQEKCFVDKKITTQTYKTNVARYEDKIAEIKHTLPVLEAQLSGEPKNEQKGVLNLK